MIAVQGDLIPFYSLSKLFTIEGADDNFSQAIIVVVEEDGNKAGLLVDEIIGKQQTVIKSLGESLQDIPGVSGGAIMSDGRVGLIIDVGGIIKLARRQNENYQGDTIDEKDTCY